jgi:hypothetical protein
MLFCRSGEGFHDGGNSYQYRDDRTTLRYINEGVKSLRIGIFNYFCTQKNILACNYFRSKYQVPTILLITL